MAVVAFIVFIAVGLFALKQLYFADQFLNTGINKGPEQKHSRRGPCQILVNLLIPKVTSPNRWSQTSGQQQSIVLVFMNVDIFYGLECV